uniref:SKICH domain-containing protein n=1 Tax=Photinus pyralis TaxID=7054 RepID=A0A1Y1NDI4_PHOPY
MNSGDLESCFSTIIPRVEFLNVQDQYSYNDDLICKYYLTDYEVQEGDRVAIFRLGWQYIKDYILFEWAPKDSEANLVVFNKPCLPKNTSEIYQFCFISGENNVLGASEPFQFSEKNQKLPIAVQIVRTQARQFDAGRLQIFKQRLAILPQ